MDSSGATEESVLAPLILGFHNFDQRVDLLKLAVWIAADSVPAVTIQRKVLFKGNRKPTDVAHTRRILHGQLRNGNFYMRLCDCRPGADRNEWLGQWQWQLTLRAVKPASVSAASEAEQTLLLSVTHFRLFRGAVQPAQQLALARHLLVSAFQSMDPDLTISGGQHDWQPSWWPEPEATPLPS
jgi:hypothetical protein